jgi:hypothetical protein
LTPGAPIIILGRESLKEDDMELFPVFEQTTVAEKAKGSSMDRLNKSDPASSRDAIVDPEKHRQPQHERREKENDEAAEHFESLKETAGLVNRELEEKKSPYRFYIYREFDDVYINLVRLDSDGKIAEVKKKNITHQEFAGLLRQIQQGEGLFFDSIG